MVIAGAVTPVANAGRAQVTDAFPLLVQTQPVPDAETNVTPVGSVSVTDTAAASDGPALATTREELMLPAATTVAGPVFTIDRSAEAVTVVVAVEVLLAPLGSAFA